MLSCYLMERRQRQRNPLLGNDLGKARFDQAFEPYRKAFILGDLHEQSFILNEFVSSLLSAEDSKLAEEQALSSSLCSEEEKSLEDILTCRLCNEVFHVPVTLVCGHTFCLDCLNCQQFGNRTVCPGCGKESSLRYSSNIVVRDLSRTWFSEKTYIRGCCIEAKKLFSEGKIVEFMNLLENLLTKHPENSELLLLRSHGFKYMQNYREALKDIDFACSLAPFNGKLFHARGELLASIDKPEEAMAMFLRASALKPNDPAYRYSLTSYLDKLLRNIYDARMPRSSKSSTFNGDDHESTAKRVMKSLPIKSMSNMDEIATTTRRNNASGKPVCESEHESELGCRSNSCENAQNNVRSTEKMDGEDSVCCKTHDAVKTNELQEGSRFQAEQSKSIVPSELECKLCFNMLYEPVTTPCGHSLCRPCLHRCLDHRFDCPCCRTDLQSYLEQIMMANIGTCEVLHKILLLKFKDDYEARRSSYINELNEFSRCESNKDEIPIFVCTLAVPGIACPLHIFEPRYKLMIRRCLESGSRQFGMCVSDAEHGFATVGTVLYINDATFLPDGRSVVHTVGSRRFKVLERGLRDGYNTAKVVWLEDECDESDRADLNNQVYDMMVHWFDKLPREQQMCIVKAVGEMPDPVQRTKTNGPKWLWWLLAAMPLNVEAKRIILSMTSVTERLNSAKRFLAILISRQ